ncbi:MAG: dihydroneopterin aldolase [Acidimicrobiia bacterium]|jgi:dihydroneopterin aldolase|nr:MAG: dihydroneopterin aldolase [Acidimicrobiia bacterium]
MSDAIVLTGIAAAGRHGVFDHERATGQRFLADLTLEINLSAAGRTDDLDETVDYGAIADAVVEVLAGPPFALIEAVAEAIAARVLEDWPQVDAVEVTVHKPDAPISQEFADVAVRIRRSRTA